MGLVHTTQRWTSHTLESLRHASTAYKTATYVPIKQPHTHSKALVHQTSFKAMGWISSIEMDDPDHNC